MLRRKRSSERGQILVLFTLVIVMLLGFVALAVDVGVLRNANQNLWNALDSGALAGVSQLPADAPAAEAMARQFVDENYPGGLPAGDVAVTFRCVIGSVGGAPRLSDVPSVCDPGPGVTWTCDAGICAAVCVPAAGDDCNTIVLEGKVDVPFRFGSAVGVPEGTTNVLASACKGACGSPPESAVDIALIVDRTSSMNGVDTTNARSAAHSVRTMLDPNTQWLALSMLGPSNTGAGCITQPDTSIGTANAPSDVPRWVPVGLSGLPWQGQNPHLTQDFTNNGSTMEDAISCFTNSSTGTDLRDPIPMSTWELNTYGRPGVTKGIILMTDGQPNASTVTPANDTYCAQANASATAAKSAGIEIFTVAFGLDGSNDFPCPDDSGFWQGRMASELVATMATNSVADNGCPGTENDDDDHYFCVPKTAGASANLTNAFRQATIALTGGSKLIHLP